MKVGLILSGGLDSTTVLYKLINEGYEVTAISFYYGQKASKELMYAQKTCTKLNIKHLIINLEQLQKIFNISSIINTEKDDTSTPKNTVVPSRNTILLELATAYAITNDLKEIYCGVHKGDATDYPDTTPEFIEQINNLNKVNNYTYIPIKAPFINMSKKEVVHQAIKLEVPFNETWSCYINTEKPCGKCYSCITRQEAIKQANKELKEEQQCTN